MAELTGTRRRIEWWLMIGMITLPLLFYGFLFRKGYSTSVRLGGGALVAMALFFGMVQLIRD